MVTAESLLPRAGVKPNGGAKIIQIAGVLVLDATSFTPAAERVRKVDEAR